MSNLKMVNSKNTSQNHSRKNILCVWLPNWPIQRLVADDNELRRTQIILYRNQPGRGQIVSAVSPAARLSGAQVGMPLSEAKSLVGRSRKFRDHHVFEHNPSADFRTLQQLAIDSQSFSPIVGLEESDPPSGLLLDISGLTHLFGGNEGLRTQIHNHFQTRGYLISTAIAPTIGQAWAMARFSDDSQGDTDPFTDTFESLPIQALRLQETTIDTLHQLGVNQICQIRSLPRAGLRSRFGDEITRRLDQADGIVDEVIDAIYPPADYEIEEFLEYPLSDRETIQVIMSRLAGQLCKQMKACGRGGLVWHFQLNEPVDGVAKEDTLKRGHQQEKNTLKRGHQPNQHANSIPITIKLFQPVATVDQLMPLVEMQMESLFRGRSFGHKKGKRTGSFSDLQIQEISVSVRNCVLLVERQRRLFDENPQLDKQALAHLINRLSGRLGAEQVLRPVLQSGAQPEDACCFEPMVGQTAHTKNRRRPSRTGNTVSPLQRPLVLHPEPIEIAAVSREGTQNDSSGIPTMFVYDHQRLHVTRHWGPERIETAWWRGPTVRRDYWRIETDDRRWLWVYRNLQNHRWFLHGEF